MKSQQFRSELSKDSTATYRLFIPVEYKQSAESSDATAYQVKVFDTRNTELPLIFENNEYILERNDPAGRYQYRIKLSKGNDLIEEQEVVIVIQKKADADISVGPHDLLEVSDKEFETTVVKTIEKMQLTVGHQQGFMTMSTSPVIVDKDSESIYRELKKYQRDDEVIKILCRVLNNEIANGSLIWKTIKVFFYYRAVEGVYFLNPLAQQRYSDANLTRFMHESCVKYLDSVNSIKNRELVMKSLLHFSFECISPQARTLSIKSLSTTGKRNELDIAEVLFKVINEDSDINPRLEAIRGLAKYDLSSFTSGILETMQDASPQVRKEISNTLQNTTIVPDFGFVTDLFENETDDSTRSILGRLIYNKYGEKAKEYFLRVLDYQDERIIAVILDILFYTSETFAIDKFQEIIERAVLSVALQKRLEEYLKKSVKAS
jgi:hypothetical protein